jgi:hypothetical protein
MTFVQVRIRVASGQSTHTLEPCTAPAAPISRTCTQIHKRCVSQAYPRSIATTLGTRGIARNGAKKCAPTFVHRKTLSTH